MDVTPLLEYWAANEWKVVHKTQRPGRSEQLFPISDLQLSIPAQRYLRNCYPNGLFRHQVEAVRLYLSGKNVALTTNTASGKSVPFFVSAIETIAKDPGARVIAIYPMKALAREQRGRWEAALQAAGFPKSGVAHIDGDVPVRERGGLLKRASIITATPDIVHAWLLPNIGDNDIWRFVRRLRLIVVDEVHSYAGVVGSNAAFLFRRLEHVLQLADSTSSYMTASATIQNPSEHLRALFGREFSLVDGSYDTSGQHELTVYLVRPGGGEDRLRSVSSFLGRVAQDNLARFICFVDSRKQTELMAAIIARMHQSTPGRTEEDAHAALDHLWRYDVLPYRAGLEQRDRAVIQGRLTSGTLRGVISTSALELGIDIPHLDLGILVGAPRSMTSLQQRIGRIGRQGPGVVVVVGGGDLFNKAVFRNPEQFFDRPFAEGTLYLENPRMQYIHAMCLARPGGEHDQACTRAGKPKGDKLATRVAWPEGFVAAFERERAGEVPPDVQSMKTEAGDTPHLVYPLRDVESQFIVECLGWGGGDRLGTLTYSQLLREAYPGAIYYYATLPYRVYRVLSRARKVRVRRDRYYTTRPLTVPPIVSPDISEGHVYRAIRYGKLTLMETSLQIWEAVSGYTERRGPTEAVELYPLEFTKGIHFSKELFGRNYSATGVIIIHPSMDGTDTSQREVAKLVYECLLIEIPFERKDIGWATGRLKTAQGAFKEGTRFAVIFDRTYGSLRLSGGLLDPGVPERVFGRALDYLQVGEAAVSTSPLDLGLPHRHSVLDIVASCARDATGGSR